MLTARLERLDVKPGEWVLDLGCGEGRHVHHLHMHAVSNVVGMDLDALSLEKAEGGLRLLPQRADDAPATGFVKGDAYRLPFPDGAFDVVICSEVLEHLPDYPRAVAEIRRVLKPGGRLCVSVPTAWVERICWKLAPPPDGYPFAPGGHIRIFDELELRYAIELQGFAYAGKHRAHGLHAPYWWLKCLFWRRRHDHPLIKLYHRFLVWDLMQRPMFTRALEALLGPVIGKSLVLYFHGKRA
jgi:SAM-dependent methyltransferase